MQIKPKLLPVRDQQAFFDIRVFDSTAKRYFNTMLHTMRKRKRGSTTRRFYKLSTETWSRWYFQYMEVWVANAICFIKDYQTYYLKFRKRDIPPSVKINWMQTKIMFTRKAKPQSKHRNYRRWRSCKFSKVLEQEFE